MPPACPFHDGRHTSKALSFYVKSLSRGNLPLMAAMFAGASNTTKKKLNLEPRYRATTSNRRSLARIVDSSLSYFSPQVSLSRAQNMDGKINDNVSVLSHSRPLSAGEEGSADALTLESFSPCFRAPFASSLSHPDHPSYVIRALEKAANPRDWRPHPTLSIYLYFATWDDICKRERICV